MKILKETTITLIFMNIFRSYAFFTALVFSTWAQADEIKPLLDPTHFQFSETEMTATLHVFNNEDHITEWSSASFHWAQDPNGADVLEKTDKLSIKPSSFELKPRTGADLQISFSGPPAGEIEQTFRIVLSTYSASEENIKLTSSFSLPVFISPLTNVKNSSVKLLVGDENKLTLEVYNEGNTHEHLDSVTVEGDGKAANQVFTISRPGWYILGNSKLKYDVSISREDCDSSVLFQATLMFKSGLVEKTQLPRNFMCSANRKPTQFEFPGSQSSLVPTDQVH